MKELIDKEETLKELCEGCGYCARQECAVERCNIYMFLSEKKPVVCVSDDFPECPKVLGCEDVMCGAECGGEQNA